MINPYYNWSVSVCAKFQLSAGEEVARLIRACPGGTRSLPATPHCLQHCTASKLKIKPPEGSKMAEGVWKGV